MESGVRKTIADIKSLKIQGARNIAKASITALILQVKNSKAKSLDSLYSELLSVSTQLAYARPTEPMTRNTIKDACNFMYMEIRSHNITSVPELKKKFISHVSEFLPQMEKNAAQLWECGSKLIQDGNVVLTHCHSSTVTGILRRAKKKGKKFEVIACETRPRYQGRITATELAKLGIKTTLIVDSAMNSFIKKADLCIVGADAVTSTGDLINKIGTSTLAHIARVHDVSFYSAAELYKFDPLTLKGNREKIEERDPKEVWEKPPRTRNLKIRNPAFDATAARYINAYITEEGLVSPQGFLSFEKRRREKLCNSVQGEAFFKSFESGWQKLCDSACKSPRFKSLVNKKLKGV